ncbi:MAG: hypothetical protein AAF968_15190 [Pseudomonadota bacterium]
MGLSMRQMAATAGPPRRPSLWSIMRPFLGAVLFAPASVLVLAWMLMVASYASADIAYAIPALWALTLLIPPYLLILTFRRAIARHRLSRKED